MLICKLHEVLFDLLWIGILSKPKLTGNPFHMSVHCNTFDLPKAPRKNYVGRFPGNAWSDVRSSIVSGTLPANSEMINWEVFLMFFDFAR